MKMRIKNFIIRHMPNRHILRNKLRCFRVVRKGSPALEIRRVSSLLDQKGAICQKVDKSFEKGIISTIIIIIVIFYNFVIIIAMTVISAVTAKIINACCLVKSLVWFVEKRYELNHSVVINLMLWQTSPIMISLF